MNIVHLLNKIRVVASYTVRGERVYKKIVGMVGGPVHVKTPSMIDANDNSFHTY
jgi:hypothetical protein